MESNTKHCLPCERIGTTLSPSEIEQSKKKLAADWKVSNDHREISNDFRFKNFYQTMAFVNAIAWMANNENHHPDLEVGFNHCLVRYSTHALNGLTQNDFICAEAVDRLFQPYAERNHERK